MKPSLIILGLLGLLATALRAEPLRLPQIFSDHMVLQRDKPVRIWGWGEDGSTVTVSFADQKQTATVADDRWEATLDPLPANATGQPLTITSGDTTLTLEDVLVGEVWLCGGQSNMEWRLRGSRNADLEIPSARYPAIRFLRIEPTGSAKPRHTFPAENGAGVWHPANPETTGDCSAVAYYFGRSLHRRLDVPVGLISAAWGGTMAQHWVTRETLETIPSAQPYIDEYEERWDAWLKGGGADGAAQRYQSKLREWQALAEAAREKGEQDPPGKPNPRDYADPSEGRIPAGPLNAMIMPLSGLTLRGALFYQGENNSFGDTWIPFPETFPAVISDWRKLFRDGELPFGIIQIAGWSTRRSMTYDMNHHTNIIREVQHQTWRDTPHTGLIVSFDANSDSNIHPNRKEPVGERSARWALAEVYGVEDAVRKGPLQWQGPLYTGMEQAGDRIRILFEPDTAQGLRLDKNDPRGFHIAGADQVFHHAEARIAGGRGEPPAVEVWSDQVPEPVAVRYAWSNLPLGSLMNGKELPAYPFRTDSWPLKPHGGEAIYQVEDKNGD